MTRYKVLYTLTINRLEEIFVEADDEEQAAAEVQIVIPLADLSEYFPSYILEDIERDGSFSIEINEVVKYD